MRDNVAPLPGAELQGLRYRQSGGPSGIRGFCYTEWNTGDCVQLVCGGNSGRQFSFSHRCRHQLALQSALLSPARLPGCTQRWTPPSPAWYW